MRFRFKTSKLLALYTEEKGAHKYPPEVVDAFVEVMNTIDAVPDERTLYRIRGLNCEKLAGNRRGQWSMRLNEQWRLIATLEDDAHGRYLLIVGITKHYR